MNKKAFWFDVESTGLDGQKNDIIQLGGLIEINGKLEGECNFTCQPFDYTTINAKALEINKLTVAKLKEFPTPQETYHRLTKLLDNYVDKYNREDKFSPAGYNVAFDVNFLKNFFLKNNNKYYGAYFDYHMINVDSLLYLFDYKGIIKLENYKLVTVAKHFGIELDAHDAHSDIKATRQVFYKLLEYFK